jgi:hypothetical protein
MIFINKLLTLSILTLLPFFASSQLIQIEFTGLVNSQDDYGLFGNSGESYSDQYATVKITYDTLLAPLDSNPDSDYGLYSDASNLGWLNFSVDFNGTIHDEVKFDVINFAEASTFDSWEPGVLYENVSFSKGSRDGNEANGEPTTNTPNTNSMEGEGFHFHISTLGEDLINSEDIPITMFGEHSLVDPTTTFRFSYMKYLIYPDGTSGGGWFKSNIEMKSFQSLSVTEISVPEPSSISIFLICLLGIIFVRRNNKFTHLS